MGRRLAALMIASGVTGSFLTATSGVAAAHRATSAPSRTITVTRADNGRSYRLHKGDKLDVQLSGPSDVTWSEPTSSNQAGLERTGGSAGVTATATFSAMKKGKEEVNATGSLICSGVCPPLALGFDVYVSVVG